MINGVYVDKDGDYCYKNGKYESGVDVKETPPDFSCKISSVLHKDTDCLEGNYIEHMIDKYNAKPCLPLEFLQ